MFIIINDVLTNFWVKFVNFLPSFFGGLLILVVGFIIADLLKRVVLTVFAFFKFERFFQRAKVMEKFEVRLWEEILAEILRWTIVIVFLIPTLEVWGLQRATIVLNQVLLFLPNVIVSVVIAFVGIVSANLASDLVRHSVRSTGATSANALAVFTRGAITFFTVLLVLAQLGVAPQLISILFTGIVGMLALAGGLAFGLGGRDIAKDLLEELRRKLK